MVNPAPLSQIDIAASAARVASARELARSQAEIVARAERTADDLTIDLMYLTQESVLVFEETHQLLVALAEREDRAGAASTLAARTARRSRTRRRMMPLTLVLQFALLAIVSAVLVEIIDPAPTDVQASDAMRAASLARTASSTGPATTKGARAPAQVPTSR